MSMMEQTAGSSFSAAKILAAPFKALGSMVLYLAENNVRVKQLEALSSLSDEQLAERGFKREEIVLKVFGATGV